MTTRIGNRFALSQIASVAMAETRLAARATPSVVRRLAPIVAWAAVAIGLGVLVGLRRRRSPANGRFRHCCGGRRGVALGDAGGAARLPGADPQGVLRHAGRQSLRSLLLHDSGRRSAVDLSPPHHRVCAYRAVPSCSCKFVRDSATSCWTVPALHRSLLSAWPAILLWRSSRFLTSPLPAESLSALVDSVLTWYVPFLAMVFIVEIRLTSIFILKIICFCALFNTAAGVLEFPFIIVSSSIFSRRAC